MTTTPGYTVEALLQAIDYWVDLKMTSNGFMPSFRESARSTILARAAELTAQNAVPTWAKGAAVLKLLETQDKVTAEDAAEVERIAKELTAERASPAKDGLLPCPFCGGEAERIDFDEGDNAGGSCISCKECNASGNVEFGYKENFVSNWNRRSQPLASQMRPQSAVQGWLPSALSLQNAIKAMKLCRAESGGNTWDAHIAEMERFAAAPQPPQGEDNE